jgi:hypothetical protein
VFRKYLPIVVPHAVYDTIHDGNITVYMENITAPSMAAGTGGNNSRRPSNGTCAIR